MILKLTERDVENILKAIAFQRRVATETTSAGWDDLYYRILDVSGQRNQQGLTCESTPANAH